MQSYCS